MDDYISREAAIKAIRDYAESRTFNSYFNGMRKAMEIVNDVPAAEVVDVIQCKDCKHKCVVSGEYTAPDDYCSFAERVEEDD